MTKKFKIKKHDSVLVVAGEHKGKIGQVLRVDKKKDRVIVEGVNVVTRHQRPNHLNPEGSVTKTKSIHISNVSHFDNIDQKTVPSKVRIEIDADGKKRILKKNNKVVEEHKYERK